MVPKYKLLKTFLNAEKNVIIRFAYTFENEHNKEASEEYLVLKSEQICGIILAIVIYRLNVRVVKIIECDYRGGGSFIGVEGSEKLARLAAQRAYRNGVLTQIAQYAGHVYALAAVKDLRIF